MSKTAKTPSKPARFGTYHPTRLGAQPAALPTAPTAAVEPAPFELERPSQAQASKRRIVPFSSRITPEAEEALKVLGQKRKTVELLADALNLLFRANNLPPVA